MSLPSGLPPERHVLVVLPHPDDETLAFGGVIALYARRGVPVTYLCGTLGEAGRNMGRPVFATRESLPTIRERELREACAVLGISDLRLLGLRDKTLEFEDPEALADIVHAALLELEPTRVLTYYPGYAVHPDHEAMADAVVRAVRRLPSEARPVVACVAFGREEDLRELGDPDVVVDVSEVLDVTMAAVRAHASQTQASLARTETRMAEDEEFRAQVERDRRQRKLWLYRVGDEVVQ
ncbi:bacillithiol biosynthesis deacetylase BshB2 [Deinococcus pimensis]|uniref:bacillithiol biosynthesis deacetylase BshB2 n=1 Tax=Deinococcus pimensis TaxID=309888 RepID=UPI000486C43E|nr:bacillithiol biosynthesis deacetylase BshB2 [Deinococcus pimensis]